MPTIDLKEFLARQLNDHSDSPSGVVQPTYFEWTNGHIEDAINLAISYLYSLIPQEFSKLKEYKVKTPTCIIEFCNQCKKFISIVSVSVNGEDCSKTYKKDAETNSLSSLLSINCTSDNSSLSDSYNWDLVDGSKCVVTFDQKLPTGAIVKYLCADNSSGIDNLNCLSEYHPLIADYALWWLYRTDSESRSNLDRARLHFEGVKDFVTTKLLIEFSLQEDDYQYARRKVDDD